MRSPTLSASPQARLLPPDEEPGRARSRHDRPESSLRALAAPDRSARPRHGAAENAPTPASGFALIDVAALAGATAVAVAGAFALHTQLGAGLEVAAAVGLGIFAVAAMLHVLLRRTDEIARLKGKIAAMERELAALHPGPSAAVRPTVNGAMAHQRDIRQADMRAAGPSAPALHEHQRDPQLMPPEPIADDGWLGPQSAVPQSTPHQAALHQAGRPQVGRPQAGRPQSGLLGSAPLPPAASPLPPVDEPSTPTVFAPAARQASGTPGRDVAPEAETDAMSDTDQKAARGGFFSGLTDKLGRASPAASREMGSASGRATTGPATTGPAPGLMAGAATGSAQGTAQGNASGAARQRVISGWHGNPVGSASPTAAAVQPGAQVGLPAAAHEQAAPPSAASTALPVRPAVPSAPTGIALSEGTVDDLAEASAEEAAHVLHMPPPADIEPAPSTARYATANPVDSLIQSIASALAAERQGVSTEELLALPAPYPEALGDGEGGLAAPPPADPASPEASALAAEVRAAVEAGRIEVHLQPILALNGLTPVSYEAFTRLKDASGRLIKPADYAMFAHRAGLTAGIEKLALLRTIHVLQQLDLRGKLCPIFINVSRELLTDGRFFAEFIDAMKGSRNLSTYLVLEFAQPVAAAFDENDLESLDTLARLGFTFAIDEVDNVEMDFEALLSRGLAFVKVSADVFRHGLIAGEAVIPTDEIRSMFEDAGLQLIVHHMSDEAGLDAALAHHVVFGQGNIFAEPKPVKAELLGEVGRAA